ncbi:MAG: TMEM43 family protein [Myxococcales bacterium]|nr:TMEM43 family protein [Myxococcales bacterium]
MSFEHDSYTEVSEETWFDRLKESIKSVGVGLLLLVAAFPLLFWNEGRAVRRARTLDEGAGSVVSIKAAGITDKTRGKLIHTAGLAKSDEVLTDPLLAVSSGGPALALTRHVEMLQWRQKKVVTKKKRGSRTVKITRYEYDQVWSDKLIPSRHFKMSATHRNPSAMPVSSKTFGARHVTLGALSLPPALVARIRGGAELPVTWRMRWKIADRSLRIRTRVYKGTYYVGFNPKKPSVGDTRVRFTVVRPQKVSVVGKQLAGITVGPYNTSGGGSIFLLSAGVVGPQAMFKQAQAANNALSWILRGVGFALLFFGLLLVFNPLAVLADRLPLAGDLLRFGTLLFAAVTSVALAGTTIAIAWVAHRPLLGIPVLVVAAASLVGLKLLGSRRKKSHADVDSSQPGTPALSAR